MWPEPDTGFHGQSGTTSRVAAGKWAPESLQIPQSRGGVQNGPPDVRRAVSL